MSTLRPASRRRLSRLIKQYRLEPAADAINALAQECVVLFRGDAEDEPAVGRSRIGGTPDLPRSVRWPRTASGERYCFIAQVNFAEVPRTQDDPLPETGLLSFFVGNDEPATDVDALFLYHDGPPADLTRRKAPPAATMANENYVELKPFLLEGRAGISLPGYGSRDMPGLEALCGPPTGDEHSPARRFIDLGDEAKCGKEGWRAVGQLLGHPEQYSGDVRMNAFLVRGGRRNLIYSTHETPEDVAKQLTQAKRQRDAEMVRYLTDLRDGLIWFHARREQVEGDARRWRSLLVIQTDYQVGLEIWDAGFFTSLIHEDDLRGRDFARVYTEVETA